MLHTIFKKKKTVDETTISFQFIIPLFMPKLNTCSRKTDQDEEDSGKKLIDYGRKEWMNQRSQINNPFEKGLNHKEKKKKKKAFMIVN